MLFKQTGPEQLVHEKKKKRKSHSDITRRITNPTERPGGDFERKSALQCEVCFISKESRENKQDPRVEVPPVSHPYHGFRLHLTPS